jgi:hypothetical protein
MRVAAPAATPDPEEPERVAQTELGPPVRAEAAEGEVVPRQALLEEAEEPDSSVPGGPARFLSSRPVSRGATKAGSEELNHPSAGKVPPAERTPFCCQPLKAEAETTVVAAPIVRDFLLEQGETERCA